MYDLKRMQDSKTSLYVPLIIFDRNTFLYLLTTLNLELNAVIIADEVIAVIKIDLRAYLEHRANFIKTILVDCSSYLSPICIIIFI